MRATPDLALVRGNSTKIREVAGRHGLANVRVFGSVARGSAHPGSDVDFLADADLGTSLLDVMAAEIELEQLLEVPVQIITTGDREALELVLADAVAL